MKNKTLDQWQRDVAKAAPNVKFQMIFTGEEQEGYRVVTVCHALLNDNILEIHVL